MERISSDTMTIVADLEVLYNRAKCLWVIGEHTVFVQKEDCVITSHALGGKKIQT